MLQVERRVTRQAHPRSSYVMSETDDNCSSEDEHTSYSSDSYRMESETESESYYTCSETGEEELCESEDSGDGDKAEKDITSEDDHYGSDSDGDISLYNEEDGVYQPSDENGDEDEKCEEERDEEEKEGHASNRRALRSHGQNCVPLQKDSSPGESAAEKGDASGIKYGYVTFRSDPQCGELSSADHRPCPSTSQSQSVVAVVNSQSESDSRYDDTDTSFSYESSPDSIVEENLRTVHQPILCNNQSPKLSEQDRRQVDDAAFVAGDRDAECKTPSPFRHGRGYSFDDPFCRSTLPFDLQDSRHDSRRRATKRNYICAATEEENDDEGLLPWRKKITTSTRSNHFSDTESENSDSSTDSYIRFYNADH